MIDIVNKSIPRNTLFLSFNAFALVFVTLFVFAPLLSHFISRGEDISENVAQLTHFQNLVRNSNVLMSKRPQIGDPFLPGNEERIVSADLQANLKAIGTAAGASLVGIRALEGKRSQRLRMVTVGMELEGPLPAIRQVILAINNQMPMLFVTEASFQSKTDGDDGLIRAEIHVQGAMHPNDPSSDAVDGISQ